MTVNRALVCSVQLLSARLRILREARYSAVCMKYVIMLYNIVCVCMFVCMCVCEREYVCASDSSDNPFKHNILLSWCSNFCCIAFTTHLLLYTYSLEVGGLRRTFLSIARCYTVDLFNVMWVNFAVTSIILTVKQFLQMIIFFEK